MPSRGAIIENLGKKGPPHRVAGSMVIQAMVISLFIVISCAVSSATGGSPSLAVLGCPSTDCDNAAMRAISAFCGTVVAVLNPAISAAKITPAWF